MIKFSEDKTKAVIKYAKFEARAWNIIKDGEVIGEIRFRRDFIKAKMTDRLRTKMANIYDICPKQGRGHYGYRSLKDAKDDVIRYFG